MATKSRSEAGHADYSIFIKRRRSMDDYSARVSLREDDMLTMAENINNNKFEKNGKICDPTFDDLWEHLMWGMDCIIQMLETPAGQRKIKKNKTKGGVSITFFMALDSFVRKCSGIDATRVYNEVDKLVTTYLTQVVLPAIKKKTGLQQLKEFVHRWENHKILTEFFRKLFHSIGQPSKQAGYVSDDTICALIVRKFCDTLWKFGKDNIVATMLSLVNEHRKGTVSSDDNRDTCAFVERCKEILCTMGVCADKNFYRITDFIDTAKANKKGKFTVLEVLTVPEDAHGHSDRGGDSAVDGVKVADHLEFYRDEFEKPFLVASAHYFSQKASDWHARSVSVPDYFVKFDDLYKEENLRVDKYLHPETKKKLQKICVEKMLAEPAQTPLMRNPETGLLVLLGHKDKEEDVRRIYEGIKVVDDFKLPGGLDQIAAIFGEFIRQEGKKIQDGLKKRNADRKEAMTKLWDKKYKGKKPYKFEPSNEDPDFVDKLRKLYMQCEQMKTELFENGARFTKVMQSSFQFIVNPMDATWNKKMLRRPAEYFVQYMDMVLKGKLKKSNLSETQIKDICSVVVDLFECLEDRLEFLQTYEHVMTQRLLDFKYRAYANERDVLTKLKLLVGHAETHHMETMLRDAGQIKEKAAMWKKHVKDKIDAKEDAGRLNPKVLERISWKLPREAFKLPVPHKVQKWCQLFEKFYMDITDQKKLSFRHDLGSATIQFKARSKKYTIMMSPVQASIVLLFNTQKELKLLDIQNAMQLKSFKVVTAIVLTLLKKVNKRANGGILTMTKPKLPLKPNDVFFVNPKFKCDNMKFKLPEVKEEKKTRAKFKPVFDMKKFKLESALVRTMKATKVMAISDLAKEATKQVQAFFRPEIHQVIRVIEKLIKQGFMKRDAPKSQTLEYIA